MVYVKKCVKDYYQGNKEKLLLDLNNLSEKEINKQHGKNIQYGLAINKRKKDFAVEKKHEPRVYIYFIKSENNMMKIGISTNPKQRLKSLKTGSPVPLKLIAVIGGSRRMEIDLHCELYEHLSHGEWFRIEDGFYDKLNNSKVARNNNKFVGI